MYSAMHQTYVPVPQEMFSSQRGEATCYLALCSPLVLCMYYPFPRVNITFLNWKNSFVERSPNENQGVKGKPGKGSFLPDEFLQLPPG